MRLPANSSISGSVESSGRRSKGSLLGAVAIFCVASSVPLAAFGQIQSAPSFVNDVEPILTRFNCNSGGCHGKLAGQNGFRLSLRGYAPVEDYRSLNSDEFGRRLNTIEPDRSLLLMKATGRVAHGGGRLFNVGSSPFKTLRAWIEQGAPGPLADEAYVTGISATPEASTLVPGDHQSLVVHATYSDGTERDVTTLARFHSNDAAYVSVSADGNLAAIRNGEVSVVVSYQGLVDTVVVTMPYGNSINDDRFMSRNNEIDDHVMSKLKSLRLPPADLCDDATFLRRVMLDLIGTLPTGEEVRAFLSDNGERKRERLVDRLFERSEFVDHWTMQIADLLQNRKERDHDVRGVKGVRAMHDWIRKQVACNRPWNELVRDVLTASGPSDQNPAVGYYVVTVGEKQAHESEVADSVAQAFLGMRIGCAKCHNHPLEKYTQDDYYHFIAFFSQVVLDRKPPTDGATVLVRSTRHLQDLERRLQNEEQELSKLQSDGVESAKIDEKQERLNQLRSEIDGARQAPPVVNQPRTGMQMRPQGFDRQPVEISAGSDPRTRLADWLTDPSNQAFAGAIVNRLWKHFFSVGLVESVDDLRDTNPPTNRPLYDYLTAEFVASNYDLRYLMKQMVLSRTYQLASDTTPENAKDSRFYSHYYAKRLPAEVMLDAICQATGVPENFQGYPQGTRAKQLPGPQIESYFLMTFGRSERVTACACERSADVTLSQLLHLQNSESLLAKFRDPSGNLVRWVAESKSTDGLLDELFLATYSRFPSDLERERLRIAFEQGDRAETATDLLWALLNAKEFAFNH